ncbi:probable cytochrome P450 301a1, mitochondrial isoform X2 [Achroia grisella]|uniref:probable cytochrome P450 301a1, mitochondrial isoform X2 n=1 Tax=Achroia grisella TaxID=688607 RepID=UPI0027D25F99|nr:probable cytochrome P450 301a1, mitochondrial isoform X2 [Achroia grisella]
MLPNQLRFIKFHVNYSVTLKQQRYYSIERARLQNTKSQDVMQKEPSSIGVSASNERLLGEIYPAAKVVPMVLTNKEPVVLSFDEVPGPKSLKYISSIRAYLSEIGTQLTASVLTMGLNIGAYVNNRKPLKNLSTLFDEYGPVVRFVSPVGADIVLINHPDHIQKVYTVEGDCPVRSTLDSLEKYRIDHRNHIYGGLYTIHGQEWMRQRSVVYNPLHSSVSQHIQGIDDVCENFANKIYNIRNNQDEIPKDLYRELHKWSFDCMGLILFSKKFTMLDTELVYSQCDMSWLYHSLEKATQAIIKCETGLHFWKLFTTPAWLSLVKYCDSLDNLIGKHVMEAEQAISFRTQDEIGKNSLINAMLMSDEKMNAEDIATIIMDMLLIGVNTVTSSMSFLLYNLAKYQRSQRMLYEEISKAYNTDNIDIDKIKEETPYLQACIKETLRLVPPIPVLTRILSRNITLDKYNIPRGTLIIMSTQDASLKENNYDDAIRFCPERWLKPDAKDYHAFASIPFGFGARKCIGQNIAETMLSMLTIRLIQKYKLEYHYGDIKPTRCFIARPNKPLKIRFVDRN